MLTKDKTQQVVCYLTLRRLSCWFLPGPHMWYLSNFLKTAMPTMARTLNFTLRRLPCWIWPGPLGSYVISLHEEYYVDYGQDPKGYVFYLSEDWDVDYGQDPRTYLLSHFEKIAMLTMARTPQVIEYLTLKRLLCWLWPGPYRLSVISLWEDSFVHYGQDPTCYLLSYFEKTAMLTMARTPQVICYITLRRLLCWQLRGPHRLYIIPLWEIAMVTMARTPQVICYLTLKDCYVDYGQDPTGYLLSHFEKTDLLNMARIPQFICYLTLIRLLCLLWPGPHRLLSISLWEDCSADYGQDPHRLSVISLWEDCFVHYG